jgi:hypothetical protein
LSRNNGLLQLLQVNLVKAAVEAADGVGQADGSANRDGGSADRIPVQQVRGNLQHIIATGRTGKQKCEIGFANGDLWR